MSGNQPVEDVPDGVGFPVIGDYQIVPGPGEEGYVEPSPESEDPPAIEDVAYHPVEGEAEIEADPVFDDDTDGEDDEEDIGEDGPYEPA